MPLRVDVGHSSLTGPRERNEDFCGMVTPQGTDLENKGLIAAVADGIGGHKGGREAAEYTVRGLLSDYYPTPDTWSVPHALEKVVVPLYRWVMAEAGRQPELAGMAPTLTILVLRGRRYVCAHVGDSRLYLLRNGVCRRLTTDHVWEHPELRNVLSRAVGLERHFHLDFADGELRQGDCFLLCSDGVWGALDNQRICGLLIAHPDAQQAAASLTSLAQASGRQDNASAVVLHVAELPAEKLRDSLEGSARLPLPPRFKPGQSFDGLRIDEVLHAHGRRCCTPVDMNYFLGIDQSGVLAADFEECAPAASGCPAGGTAGLNHPVKGTTVIQNNVWYQVAVAYDGRYLTLYLNGIPETTTGGDVGATRYPRWDSTQHAGLGSALQSSGLPGVSNSIGPGYFAGMLDEVRIWNRPLSQSEIRTNINLEVSNATNLIGRWGMNDGSGLTAINSVGSSPNGTLTNGPAWTTGAPFNLVFDSIAPDAPTNLMSSPRPGAALLEWTANTESDLAGYRVYRSTSSPVVKGTPINGTLAPPRSTP